jgi:ribosome-binding ATPase YchF (GTP1/OBG family)
MKISLGLCGLPNSGKSTLIKLLTNLEIAIAPYPFTTLKSQEYAVPIVTDELIELHSITKTKEIIYPYLIFVDVPGLIKNAHKGEGLGNEFLSYLRGCQVIIEVVRNFYRQDVPHVEGRIDPLADVMIIEEEIIFADQEIIKRHFSMAKRQAKDELADLGMILSQIQLGKRFPELNEKFKKFNLLITKNWFLLINGNCSKELLENEKLDFFKNRYCLDFLWEIDLMNNQELQTEFKPKIIEFLNNLRKDLEIIQFFTFTKNITQGWFTFKGTKIIEAVSQIHSDFVDKFKTAETLSLTDFFRVKSWEEAKRLGLVKNKGKEADIEENEIIFVKI